MDNEYEFLQGLKKEIQRPDILDCIANLSNDEVFTPSRVANEMLDILPQELFSDPNTKFLDPVCKEGVFLREIVKRLIKGLETQIPDLQERVNHIMTRQVFGIAITDLTALISRRIVYCCRIANDEDSICTEFTDEDGNIKWNGTKNQFIHLTNQQIKEYQDMKFDVIMGNPPYQQDDGGHGASAKPIYHLFIQQAKKLQPRYLSMIIPARWYAGGKGLDEFRNEMLSDKSIRALVDYPVAKECFESVSIAGGVCYFLWDRDEKGLCEFTSIHKGNKNTLIRDLAEHSIFVRHNQALTIIKKAQQFDEKSISTIMSSRNPFGFSSAERGNKTKNTGDLTLNSSGGIGYVSENKMTSGHEYLDKYKFIISKVTSEHAGESDKDGKFRVISANKVLAPKEICTDSYIVVGAFSTKSEAQNLQKYILTKFVRFLLLQAVSSINLSKDKFQFIPLQNFNESWSDEKLYAKYNLTPEEIAFIESMIRPMDNKGGDDE